MSSHAVTQPRPAEVASAVAAAVAGQRVRLRVGQQVVAVVPLDDLELLAALDREEDRLLGEAAAAAKAAALAAGEEPLLWDPSEQESTES
ncbi:MAG: hypothetical protein IT204_03740 [Fimbriimonadaceae bacterium]|nr:hypothetical protein [Fimbriimonadaceae bacterium]